MIKRYPLKLVKVYRYADPETGEQDDLLFIANGALFPLFKSLSGVELGDALAEYKKSILGVLTPESAQLIAEFGNAQNVDEQFAAAQKNPELLISMLRAAQDAALIENAGGFSLIELLLICTRICALPEGDRSEALAAGLELLPDEVYQDPQFAFEILSLAVQYDDHAKKNSDFLRTAKRNAPR